LSEIYKIETRPEGIPNTTAYKIRSRMMVLLGGSPAYHQLGDLGRENENNLIHVIAEDENYYIGTFSEGYGFFNVHFPKNCVRPMDIEEVDALNKTYYTMNNTVYGKNSYDYDGYRIEG
jgi:hypothetical protein